MCNKVSHAGADYMRLAGAESGLLLKSLVRFSVRTSRTQSSCEKSIIQRSIESRWFSMGTSVSSHKEGLQGRLGNMGPQ